MTYKVLITETINDAGIKVLKENKVEILQASNADEIELFIKECDGLIVRAAKITEDLLAKADRLKAIGRYGAGYDNVDIKKCTEKGISVMNVPFGNTVSVAEYVIGAMLTLAKDFNGADKSVRAGQWNEYRLNRNRIEVSGKVLGIIGFGQIGKEIARKAIHGFNMNVKVFDPYINADEAKTLGIYITELLDELVSEVDFLTINVPLTESTRNLIGLKQFKNMKKTAFLVNASRGGIIVEQDLIVALKEGLIAGACIDVFEKEPPNTLDSLFSTENIIFSPHIAGLTEDAEKRISQTAAQQVLKVLNGETPDYIVNKELLLKKRKIIF